VGFGQSNVAALAQATAPNGLLVGTFNPGTGRILGVDPTVVSPTAISMTASPGSVYIEVEPTLPSRKCQEDLYDFAQYVSRNEKSDFILTPPHGSS
jgi:hypothetical protein